jgi:hypothetical protein
VHGRRRKMNKELNNTEKLRSCQGIYRECFFFLEKGPAADATDAPADLRHIVQPCDEDDNFFLVFPSNGAPVE